MPLTVSILEDRLLSQISPGNPARFHEILTQADERLLELGKWSWTRGPLDLTPVDGVVSLPAEYVSIVGCRIGSMASGVLWQEISFVEEGPGLIPIEGTGGQLLDLGVIDGVRQYQTTGSDPGDIVVLARFAPRSLEEPADIPLCQSFAALKQAMLSIVYEERNDLERSVSYMQSAEFTLNKKEIAYRGAAKKIFDPKIYGPPTRRSSHNFP